MPGHPPPHPYPPDPDVVEELPEDRIDFSRSLALFSRGYSRELQLDLEGAVTHYRRVLEIDPHYYELYLRLAHHYIRLDRIDQAEEIMDALIAVNPTHPQAHIWKALVHRTAEQPERAKAAYRRAMELDPSLVIPYLQLANMYLQEGDTEETIRILKEGLDHTDQPVALMRLLGDVYLRRSDDAAEPDRASVYRERAVTLFKDALEEEPDDPSLLYSLARLYLLDERLDEAISVFEQLEVLRPEDMPLKWQLADAYILAGRPEQAIQALEEVAERHPANARLYMRLGELYRAIGDAEGARINFKQATQTGRPDPSAWLNLALVQMEDDWESAVESLYAGLQLMPDNPRMQELMAYVYHENDKHEQALHHFEQAENLFREQEQVFPSTHFLLFYAVSSLHAGSTEQTAELLVRAVEQDPVALDGFAHVVFQSDTDTVREDARMIWDLVAEALPDNPFVPMYIGYLNSYEKEYGKAITAFDEAVERARTTGQEDALDAAFYFWYAAAHEREGDIERAEKLFYECLERDPEHAEAYNYLAYMWAEKGMNLDRAYEYVTIALEQKPDSGAFIDTLGWIYYMQGEYEKAYDEIKRALELLPDDPTVLDHMGDIYLKLDDLDNALTKWKRSFVIDPDNEEVEDKLADHGADLEALREEAARRKEEPEEDPDGKTAPEEQEDIPDEEAPDSTPEEPAAAPNAPELFEPVTRN